MVRIAAVSLRLSEIATEGDHAGMSRTGQSAQNAEYSSLYGSDLGSVMHAPISQFCPVRNGGDKDWQPNLGGVAVTGPRLRSGHGC